jgi:hypothetical protein
MSTEKQVKVWNDNFHPYEEKFQGTFIRIEPHKCIEMDYDQAVLFLGTFIGFKRKKDGTQDPKSFKKLRIDAEDKKEVILARSHSMDSEDKEKVFLCHVCRKEFLTKKGLEKHIKDKHLSEMADKEAMKEMHDREDI